MLDNLHELNALGNNGFIRKMVPAVIPPARHEVQSQPEPGLLLRGLSGCLSS